MPASFKQCFACFPGCIVTFAGDHHRHPLTGPARDEPPWDRSSAVRGPSRQTTTTRPWPHNCHTDRLRFCGPPRGLVITPSHRHYSRALSVATHLLRLRSRFTDSPLVPPTDRAYIAIRSRRVTVLCPISASQKSLVAIIKTAPSTAAVSLLSHIGMIYYDDRDHR
ncbi:hypothetical protein MRX96_040398 [Rhipicephalus microplus]